jgi:L-rhamnose isomerase/sugar isomerase
MIDQSHNVTDPIESLMQSAIELQRAYAQALLVERDALESLQECNDALGAHLALKRAYTTDVSPILAMARKRGRGAIDPIGCYRQSGYRARKAKERPATGVATAGIV